MNTAESKNAERERGRICAWGRYHDFGFASRDLDPKGRQVFIHVNHVDGQCRLSLGTPVEFVVTETAKRTARAAREHTDKARE